MEIPQYTNHFIPDRTFIGNIYVSMSGAYDVYYHKRTFVARNGDLPQKRIVVGDIKKLKDCIHNELHARIMVLAIQKGIVR